MIRTLSLSLVFTLALTACSDPRSTIVPADIAAWEHDADLREAAQALDDEERRLMAAYAVRRAFSGSPGQDKPIRAVLADQRAFEAEAQRREAEALVVAQRVAAEQEAAQRVMFDTVAVGLVSFEARQPNYQARRYSQDVALTVGFENKTDRPIRAIRGVLHFADSFEAPIKDITFTYEGGVGPRDTATWRAGVEINQFIAEDMKLFTADPATLRFRWEPTGILFADGTLLSAEVR